VKRIPLGDIATTAAALHASAEVSEELRRTVGDIVAEVRRSGDAALCEFTRRFDGVAIGAAQGDAGGAAADGDATGALRVPPAALAAALGALAPELADALRLAAANIRAYHERELPRAWRETLAQGQVVGQEIVPLAAAGLYVPGGLADYPSSVLMTAIPAQVAGVERIVVCSPPRGDGSVPPGVAAACALLGLDHVVPVGGAQAVAALACGTASVPRCDIIVGPGNRYVTEAKRQVMGEVAIDSLAGPSEVLIVAGEGSDPTWLAADVLAQAEHGAGAMGALLSLSPALGDALEREIPRLAAELGVATDEVTIVDCPSAAAAMELVNVFAPEHLELHVDDAGGLLGQVRNAGAVFVGRHAATAFADYAAGTNHVLPTRGAARFSQGLSASAFVKRVAVMELDAAAAAGLAGPVVSIAREEGYAAHALSAELRGGAHVR
jgi:histidinol dehydrogenase